MKGGVKMYYTVPKVIFENYKNQSYKQKLNNDKSNRVTQLNELILIPYLFSKRYMCNMSKVCVASINLLLNWVGLDLHHRRVNMIKESFNMLDDYDWFSSDYSNDNDKNTIINISNLYENNGRFIIVGFDELGMIFKKMISSNNLDLLNLFVVLKSGCHANFDKIEGTDIVRGISFSESNINYKQIQAYTGIKKDSVIKKGIDELVECGVMSINVTKKDKYKYHTYYFNEIINTH